MNAVFVILTFMVVVAALFKCVSAFMRGPGLAVETLPEGTADFAAATARLEQRVDSIERIIAAENPSWNR